AAEVERARALTAGLTPSPWIELVASDDGDGAAGSDAALGALLAALSRVELTAEDAEGKQAGEAVMARDLVDDPSGAGFSAPRSPALSLSATSADSAVNASPAESESRLRRQFGQMVEHTQRLMREAEFRRAEYWAEADA